MMPLAEHNTPAVPDAAFRNKNRKAALDRLEALPGEVNGALAAEAASSLRSAFALHDLVQQFSEAGP